MAEQYRKFDIEKLQHQEHESKFKQILQKLLTFIVALFFLTLIFYLIAIYFIQTPQQRLLQEQTRQLKEQYKIQYNEYVQLEKAVKYLEKENKNIYKVIFESNPPKQEPLTDFDTLDKMTTRQIINWNTRDLRKMITSWPKIKRQYSDLVAYVKDHVDQLQHIPSIQPVPNSNLRFVVYGFGIKIDPVYKVPSFHKGIDFAAPGGTPIFATADGIVTQANQKVRGLGLHVVIDHGNGYTTMYAHMSEISVHQGQKVTQGQIIGYVGNTGKALLPHLHYEVRYKGKPVNPIYFFFLELSPRMYYKLKTEAQNSGISLD